jgi:hypothetical protein
MRTSSLRKNRDTSTARLVRPSLMALLVKILAVPALAATPTAAERVAIYAQTQVSEVWDPDP